MQSQSAETGGILSPVLDTFKAVFPAYLDHKYGRDPNTVYGPDQQQAYGFTPATDNASNLDRSKQIFGDAAGFVATPAGMITLGVAALIGLKVAKVI